ncbi:LLM class flavin-dependent oxidoreductase [Mammaliicoccus lentus]|uniref:LLM class flavin-dependent oxidoreductase n=1 Tax=Mammaliicoccus lentus TaxID=42858 RepID=UPI003514B3EC
MKYGLLLPNIKGNEIFTIIENLNSITQDSIDSVWLRDIPVALNEDKDEGNWYDPIILATILNRHLKNPDIFIGTAVINTLYRRKESVLRSAINLQYLCNNKFILGIGNGEKEGIYNILDADWNDKYKYMRNYLEYFSKIKIDTVNRRLINQLENQSFFSIPSNVSLPLIYLATSNRKVITQYKNHIHGILTWMKSPKDLSSLQKSLSPYNIKISNVINIMFTHENKIYYKEINGLTYIVTNHSNIHSIVDSYDKVGINRLIFNVYKNDYNFLKKLKEQSYD